MGGAQGGGIDASAAPAATYSGKWSGWHVEDYDGAAYWEAVFYTSGTLTVTGTIQADAWGIGGGGGCNMAQGGGSGYTNMALGLSLSGAIAVTIGEGGAHRAAGGSTSPGVALDLRGRRRIAQLLQRRLRRLLGRCERREQRRGRLRRNGGRPADLPVPRGLQGGRRGRRRHGQAQRRRGRGRLAPLAGERGAERLRLRGRRLLPPVGRRAGQPGRAGPARCDLGAQAVRRRRLSCAPLAFLDSPAALTAAWRRRRCARFR